MPALLRQRLFQLLPWFIGPLGCGLLALCLGQDANWDLRNYHFYNPHALLHGRIGYDVAPAQIATFYNPLLYLPFYQAVIHLPPMWVGFLLGAAQGLNFPLLLAIARNFMTNANNSPVIRWRLWLIALTGLLGAPYISELGTMFSDNLTSLPILGGLLLLLANFHRLSAARLSGALPSVLGAGLLIGLAAGLKQPAAIFAVGWCVAFLFIPLPVVRRVSLAFFFGIGVLGGIAAGGGYWLHEMWIHYGNPLFPYFNRFFQSPMAALSDYRDARFLPRSLFEAIFFPLVMAWNPWHASEAFFRDLRLPLFAVLLGGRAVHALAGRVGGARSETFTHAATVLSTAHKQRFLLAGGLVAYVAWLKLFGIYRYLMPLGMLMPLGLWLLIADCPWRDRAKHYLALSLAVLLLVTLRPGNWGRVSWGENYFGFTPPPLADPARTMVLMAGIDPMAYVIPFFPAPVRFVRIDGYFTGPSAHPHGYDRLIRKLVTGHRGPLYVLYRSYEEARTRTALAVHRLTLDSRDCRTLTSHIEEGLDAPLRFCAATPLPANPQ